jgi:hypothetical protein
MSTKIAVLTALACLGASLMLLAKKADTKAAERYIIESERQWAASTGTGDTATVERVAADDFVGVDTDGSFFDKAKEIAQTRDSPKTYLSNRLDDVKVRFFGDAAVAQGTETWERRTGTPKRGRFVWTDTWVLRTGKWQVVATESLVAPELTPPQK